MIIVFAFPLVHNFILGICFLIIIYPSAEVHSKKIIKKKYDYEKLFKNYF